MARANSDTADTTPSLCAIGPVVGQRNGGTLSVTSSRSMAGQASTSAALPVNKPCAAQTITCSAPAWRSASAARLTVSPLAMRSS